MNGPSITLERSFYFDGRPRPDHDSACILLCPECSAERATWTYRPAVGDVAAECPECSHVVIVDARADDRIVRDMVAGILRITGAA